MSDLNLTILAKLRPPTSKNNHRKSLVGQCFTRLTVCALMGHTKTTEAMSYWLCRCQCGKWRIVAKQKLTSGLAKSCGCYKTDLAAQKHRTHGLSKTLVYRRWSDMHTRCYNPRFKQYADYGGRGIQVEKRWHSFENFYADMGEPSNRSYQIERRNNDGNYGRSNCYWATQKQQARNKRNSVFLSANGETHCVSEWAEILHLSPLLIAKRKRSGWPDAECLGFKDRPSANRYRRKSLTTG